MRVKKSPTCALAEPVLSALPSARSMVSAVWRGTDRRTDPNAASNVFTRSLSSLSCEKEEVGCALCGKGWGFSTCRK